MCDICIFHCVHYVCLYITTECEWLYKMMIAVTEPFSMDAPMIVSVQDRSIDLVWSQPRQPNGIIIQYKIYQNQQPRETVS